jgi:hypothetical protein
VELRERYAKCDKRKCVADSETRRQ